MSFSFEKQTVECACNYQVDPTEKYNGLLPKQLAKERNPNIYMKESIPAKPLKEKKVSLKNMKNKSKQISSESQKLLEEKTGLSCQSEKNFFNEDNAQMDFLGKIKPSKETRQWMEKKKSQIQIKSISRVPTREVYKTPQPVKLQDEQIKKIQVPVTQISPQKQKINHIKEIIPLQLPLQPKEVVDAAFKKHRPQKIEISEEPSSPRKEKISCHRHTASGLSNGQSSEQEQSSPFGKKSLPFTIKEIYPKQIESVVDENQDWDDQFSQVISHEWTLDDDDGFKDGKMPNTMFSMTTNAQISTVKNSYAK